MSTLDGDTPMPAGIYRHFKGFYVQVLGIAQHTETKELMVVYVSLSNIAGIKIRVRPLTMFLEEVEVDGQRMPRFQYIGPELPRKENQ